MSMERSAGVPGEAAPPVLAGADASVELPQALRLQIMATEHWSLLASRSLAWNEAFARAGMYLSALSGAIVALALVGQGSGFSTAFLTFGVVILPVVLFVGIATFLRLGVANYHEAQCVIGMNRIRAAYLELAPDLAPLFVMGVHDDPQGIARTMAIEPGVSPLVHQLAATPTVVSVVNAVVAGGWIGLAGLLAGVPEALVLLGSMAAFLAVLVAHVVSGKRRMERAIAGALPLFPPSSNA